MRKIISFFMAMLLVTTLLPNSFAAAEQPATVGMFNDLSVFTKVGTFGDAQVVIAQDPKNPDNNCMLISGNQWSGAECTLPYAYSDEVVVEFKAYLNNNSYRQIPVLVDTDSNTEVLLTHHSDGAFAVNGYDKKNVKMDEIIGRWAWFRYELDFATSTFRCYVDHAENPAMDGSFTSNAGTGIDKITFRMTGTAEEAAQIYIDDLYVYNPQNPPEKADIPVEPLSIDFEDGTSLAANGFTVDTDNAAYGITQNPDNPDEKVAFFEKPQDSNKLLAGLPVPPEFSKTLVLEYKIMTNTLKYKQLPQILGTKNDGTNYQELTLMVMNESNKFDFVPYSTSQEYELGKWYTIKMIIDTQTDTFSAFVDGKQAVTNQALNGKIDATSIDKIQFHCFDGANDFYLDDLYLYSPENAPVRPAESDVAPGIVAAGTEVRLSSTTGDAQIYYTTDGSVPTSKSTPYNAPIVIEEETFLKTVAYLDGKRSTVRSYRYIPEDVMGVICTDGGFYIGDTPIKNIIQVNGGDVLNYHAKVRKTADLNKEVLAAVAVYRGDLLEQVMLENSILTNEEPEKSFNIAVTMPMELTDVSVKAFLWNEDLMPYKKESVLDKNSRDEYIVNSLGMEFAQIIPGTFLMGSTNGELDEAPVHEVTITNPFYMATTEVTNAQYEEFDPSHKTYRNQMGWSKADDEAVLFVSWEDAVAFCDWLSEKEGRTYRLPTEAEWEYACRAGSDTDYFCGDVLTPEWYNERNQVKVMLERNYADQNINQLVAQAKPNAWGLYDMHGNVEEWCSDWYGPYKADSQTDPLGRQSGTYKVARGGSHSTYTSYLRSANRSATLPTDKSMAIGFRLVLAEDVDGSYLPAEEENALWSKDVSQTVPENIADGPDAAVAYFEGPNRFVNLEASEKGPFYWHNHQPAIEALPNGDLMTIWYTCDDEEARSLVQAASRKRFGTDTWEPASIFWSVPDRNVQASEIWYDKKTETLYHFSGLAAAGGIATLAITQRTSKDYGATWSEPKIINPEHGYRNSVITNATRLKDGRMVFFADAVYGASIMHYSDDDGKTWVRVNDDEASLLNVTEGGTGPYAGGIHVGFVELENGDFLTFGRAKDINGKMVQSKSSDGGKTWTYSESEFAGIGSGQRPSMIRLSDGGILFASFAGQGTMSFEDAAGVSREQTGLYVALSYDEGRTWPYKKLVTDGKEDRIFRGGDNSSFTMGPNKAEPGGYTDMAQTPDGLIHLITSANEYAFNIEWIKTPAAAE